MKTELKRDKKPRWWEKRVRGWTVPFWYTDTPLCSFEFAHLGKKERSELINELRENRNG